MPGLAGMGGSRCVVETPPPHFTSQLSLEACHFSFNHYLHMPGTFILIMVPVLIETMFQAHRGACLVRRVRRIYSLPTNPKPTPNL